MNNGKLSFKDKLYFYFAEKNWGVRREYGPYVDANRSEHEKYRIKHWWILFRLNFHYRILRRKNYMLDLNSIRVQPVNKANPSKKTPPPPKVPTVTYLSPQNRRYDRFRFIHEIWNTTGNTGVLIDTLRTWEQSWWCWKNDNPEVFLIYICCLLEADELNEAKRVLNKYIDNIGYNAIWKYMPVSQLFVKMGYKDYTIEKSAFVFEGLEKNRNDHIFEKLLAGKSIAIIGNGPSEVGKKRGEEIDSHDIVIRMNNFRLDGYEEDYGTKTSIWVRCSHRSLVDRDFIDDVDFVLWESDYWHIHIQYDHLDLMYRDIRIASDRIGYMHNLRKEICADSGVLNPTTGCQLVFYFEKHRTLFKKLDYYGFSFMESSSDMSYKHYFNEPTSAKTDHQVAVEVNYMRKLVFGEKKLENINAVSSDYNLFRIYACAFRNYDIKKGHTGGPGGVLAMQRNVLGDAYKSCPIQYLFAPSKIKYPPEVTAQLNFVCGKLKGVLQGSYFIQSHPAIKHDLDNHITPVLFCHDIGTAYGAFLLGLKYCVVYHQQGSIINELIASGGTPTDYEIDLMNKIERRVLENAVRVYFPSKGAKQVLINTSETIASSEKIPYAEYALYNTIPDAEQVDNGTDLLKKLGIPEIDRSTTDIFFSCGDFNYDKGMDRIPLFLNEYAKKSTRNVVWIAIGSAGSHDIFKNLESEQQNWSFESYLFGTRTDHATLLSLMEYCDYYIMLHRNSIFDLATLEAMRAGAALILSPIGGNLEFNVEENVVYADDTDWFSAIKEICSRNYKAWCESNINAFYKHFSHERFYENYRYALDDLLNEAGFANLEIFSKATNYDDVITVTGIFTESYRSVVELQMRSCKDNYRFDYRFISNEEWAKSKTSNDFAFYGGNIIKTQLVIDKIKQYWGKYILVCDADVVFFKRTEKILHELIGDRDMIFLRERSESSEPFEKTPLNINIGFVLIKCNQKSLYYWETVQKRTKDKSGWDQEEANLVLMEFPDIIRWSLLPQFFLNGNEIAYDNIKQQYICTGCGSISNRLNRSKYEYLNEMLLMANGKRKTWFDGTMIE